MHNGGIADFPRIKRRLQTELPDVAFNMVQGNTGTLVRYPITLSKLLRIPCRLRVGLRRLPLQASRPEREVVQDGRTASGHDRDHRAHQPIDRGGWQH